jgi:hypothetical protein
LLGAKLTDTGPDFRALVTDVELGDGVTATAGAMASTTAGANCGSSAFGAGNRRACRRQVNTCCGVSPCRRAISETTAPGPASPRRSGPCSLENQRRRPVSVITSSRRALTSDLGVWSSIDTSRSLQRDREPRLSHVPREGGSGTTLTFDLANPFAGHPEGGAEFLQGRRLLRQEASSDSRRWSQP